MYQLVYPEMSLTNPLSFVSTTKNYQLHLAPDIILW